MRADILTRDGATIPADLSNIAPGCADARWDGFVCLVEQVGNEWREVHGTRGPDEQQQEGTET